jgi:hypothetical protein
LNKFSFQKFISLIIFSILITHCSDSGNPAMSEDEPELIDYYADNIQPIFSNSCGGGCHIGGTQGGLDLSPNVSYDNLISVGANGYPGSVRVAPFDAANSVLYNKIANTGMSGQQMPPGGPMLSASEITLIEDWINDGAPFQIEQTEGE